MKSTPKTPDGKALVVVNHWQAYVLCWQGNEQIEGLVASLGYNASKDGCPLRELTGQLDDELKLENGVYIVELVEDSGEDANGEACFTVTTGTAHSVPAPIWKAHLDGEWPWEPYPEPEDNPNPFDAIPEPGPDPRTKHKDF